MVDPQPQTSSRYRALDALRGLASVKILFSHVLAIRLAWVARDHWYVRFTPIGVLTDIRIGVITFFVLSGFAMHAMMSKADFRLSVFFARRFVRLYPPFAIAITFSAIAWLLCTRIGHAPDISFTSATWEVTTSWSVLSNFMLSGGQDIMRLDPPVWSLVHEVRSCIIFPIYFYAYQRYGCPVAFLGVALSLIACKVFAIHGQHWYSANDNVLYSFLITMHLFTCFIIGSLCYRHLETLKSISSSRPTLSVGSLLLAYILFRHLRTANSGFSDYPRAIMAMWLMVIVLSVPLVSRFLEKPIFHFFSSVAYSLYLFHYPIILIFLYIRPATMPLSEVALAAIVTSFVVALAVRRFVEQPFQTMSRRIGRRHANVSGIEPVGRSAPRLPADRLPT